MAAELQFADSSEQVTPNRRKEGVSELFIPKNTLDHPCDIVLIVQDGREFKAHRRVLSEASPFFEKLLNSDMKESQEGVVRRSSSRCQDDCGSRKHTSFVTKYKPETNTWEDVTSFIDHLD